MLAGSSPTSLSSSCHNAFPKRVGKGEKKGLEGEETHPDTKNVGRERGREGKKEGGKGREGSSHLLKGPGYRKGPAIFPIHFSVSCPEKSSEWFPS